MKTRLVSSALGVVAVFGCFVGAHSLSERVAEAAAVRTYDPAVSIQLTIDVPHIAPFVDDWNGNGFVDDADYHRYITECAFQHSSDAAADPFWAAPSDDDYDIAFWQTMQMLAGDIDLSGTVDVADTVIAMNNLGATGFVPDLGDVNGDMVVTASDITIINALASINGGDPKSKYDPFNLRRILTDPNGDPWPPPLGYTGPVSAGGGTVTLVKGGGRGCPSQYNCGTSAVFNRPLAADGNAGLHGRCFRNSVSFISGACGVDAWVWEDSGCNDASTTPPITGFCGETSRNVDFIQIADLPPLYVPKGFCVAVNCDSAFGLSGGSTFGGEVTITYCVDGQVMPFSMVFAREGHPKFKTHNDPSLKGRKKPVGVAGEPPCWPNDPGCGCQIDPLPEDPPCCTYTTDANGQRRAVDTSLDGTCDPGDCNTA